MGEFPDIRRSPNDFRRSPGYRTHRGKKVPTESPENGIRNETGSECFRGSRSSRRTSPREDNPLTAKTLFPLRPSGLGSPNVESLASYVCRLAEAHSVGVATLGRHVIIPEIGIDDRGKGLRYLASRGHLVNGVGKVAHDWLRALSLLTGKDFFRGTNLLPLESVTTPRHLLRKTAAWCPLCLEDRFSGREEPFESLAWSVLIVKHCPTHGIRLSEACPRCGSKVPFFSANRRVGCCPGCRRWLGGKYEPIRRSPKEDPVVQIRIAEIVGDLLTDLPSLDGKISPRSLAEGIRKTINIASDGNLSNFAKMIGKKKGAVSAWRSGAVIPSLQEIVRIAFSSEISAGNILTGMVSNERNSPERTIERFPETTTPRNSYRSRTILLEKELRLALEQEEFSRSVASICQTVGVPTRYAWLHCPDLAKEVSEKRKRSLCESFEMRELTFEKELSQKVKDLREQGVYPSLRLIGETIVRKAKLRKDQKRSLWKGETEELRTFHVNNG